MREENWRQYVNSYLCGLSEFSIHLGDYGLLKQKGREKKMWSTAGMILLKANFCTSYYWGMDLIVPQLLPFERKCVLSTIKWVPISWSKLQTLVAKATSVSKETCLNWLLHLFVSIYVWPGITVKKFIIESKRDARALHKVLYQGESAAKLGMSHLP